MSLRLIFLKSIHMKREVTYKFNGKIYVAHINNKGMLIVLLGAILTFLNIAIEIPGYNQLFMFICFFFYVNWYVHL